MKTSLWLIIIFLIPVHLSGQANYPPDITCSKVVVYKSIDTVDLRLWFYNPPNHSPESASPAIVFYFGGGWNAGTPSQFIKHAEYLAARGMVAMLADYRVASRNHVKVISCVADAKSSIRWIREHAEELGVDPDRIAAGGGSAGGHLAAATDLLPKFDEPGENLDVSSKPNALVLFNPALALAPIGNDFPMGNKESLAKLADRLGAEAEDLSPYHHILKGLAPTIIFHGAQDKTVPYKSVEAYTNEMNRLGNNCILVGYTNAGHGFFNYGRNNNGAFVSTVSRMDEFFVNLGWLEALPEVL